MERKAPVDVLNKCAHDKQIHGLFICIFGKDIVWVDIFGGW